VVLAITALFKPR